MTASGSYESGPAAPNSDRVAGYEPVRNPRIEIPPEVEAAIRRDCTAAAEDAIGPGYTPDYYQQVGADYEWVALGAYCRGVAAGRAER